MMNAERRTERRPDPVPHSAFCICHPAFQDWAMTIPIHSMRRWHWAVIGLVAGAVLGWARHLGAIGEPVGGRGFISQARLGEALRVPPVRGKPFVGGITIRRTPQVDLVTLRLL